MLVGVSCRVVLFVVGSCWLSVCCLLFDVVCCSLSVDRGLLLVAVSVDCCCLLFVAVDTVVAVRCWLLLLLLFVDVC